MATRREKVILELEDNFTSGMARAAAATAVLDKQLNSLSGSAVSSKRGIADLNKGDGLPALERNSAGAGRQIDRLSGRLQLIAQAASVLGPALVPIGAAAVPAMAGMAAQLTVTAAAAGTAVLAFKGVGEGLKALNEYQLDPSAENFQKMQIEMEKLGPAGADFVRFLDDIAPKLTQLQMTAREGMFPGVEDGITSLLDLLPQVNEIVGNVSTTMGQLAREAGAGLSGEGFSAFFDYLERDASPILLELGRTVGNLTEGLANMLVSFAPLSSDFSGGMLEMSQAFSEWSANLGGNDSFQAFLDYVSSAGPKVIDLIGSLVDAFVQIAQAAAPIGNVVLPALTGVLDIVAKIADSPLGTMFFTAAAGMALYTRSANLAAAASTRLGIKGTTGLARFNAMASGLRTVGTGVGLAALAMTDLDDKAGLSNTAMLAMVGTLGGPWGVAAGAAVGFTMDLASANDDLAASTSRAMRAMESGGITEQREAYRGLRSELRETKDAQDNFWSIGPAAGQSLGDKLSSDMDALSGWVLGTDDAKGALGDLGGAMDRTGGIAGIMARQVGMTGEEMRMAAMDARDFSGALGQLSGWLDQRAALRQYRQDVEDFGKALNNGFQPKNVEGLDRVAASIAQVASGLKGEHRTDFLADAREDLIRFARTGPKAEAAVGRVIDKLVKLGLIKPVKLDVDNKGANRKLDDTGKKADDVGKKHPKPKVDAETEGADRDLNSTQQLLRVLDGKQANPKVSVSSNAADIAAQTEAILNSISDEIVTIHTVRTGRGGQGAGYDGGADGMTIPGQRHPYGDKVPVLTAPGEEIISNRFGQADRHRDLLKAINANRYADGGTVSHRWHPPAASMSSTRTVETRVVERMPGQVVLSIPGMGRLVASVADGRIADNEKWHERHNDRD